MMTSSEARERVLTIEGLSVGFRQRRGAEAIAVQDVSLAIDAGEVVAVVGESGSGKSVTAMSVLNLLPVNARVRGSIRFRDRELVDADAGTLAEVRGRRIAMIFQDPFGSLDPVFTIGFQIRETLRRHFPDLSAAERRERAIELLRSVELRDPEKRAAAYPHQLSGGQAQRVIVALALACGPDLLIADEPTTALDVTVQREILDLLMRVREGTGTAILIITHDMGVVADVADRVIVMREGRVVESQEVEGLFTAPRAPYTRALLDAVPKMGATERARVDGADRTLTIEGLHVDYRQRFRSVRAVEDATLHIDRGEVLALVGESGSGKSTIGRAVVGLAPISAGEITVEGVSTSGLGHRAAARQRRRIGMIFQNPLGALDPRFTMGEVVAEPLRVHLGLRGVALRHRVGELFDAVGLMQSWTMRYGHELSGGQRQRVAIARALALEPALLIADEPTSALDVSVQATVLELFRSLQRELRFACLFISHDLAVVDSLADRVVVMRHARIVEQGDRTAVLTRPQEEYTRRLLESAPIPDPAIQRQRREARQRR